MQEVFKDASVRQQHDIKHGSSEAFSDVPCVAVIIYDHFLLSLFSRSISLSSCLLPVPDIETCDSSEWETRAISSHAAKEHRAYEGPWMG